MSSKPKPRYGKLVREGTDPKTWPQWFKELRVLEAIYGDRLIGLDINDPRLVKIRVAVNNGRTHATRKAAEVEQAKVKRLNNANIWRLHKLGYTVARTCQKLGIPDNTVRNIVQHQQLTHVDYYDYQYDGIVRLWHKGLSAEEIKMQIGAPLETTRRVLGKMA